MREKQYIIKYNGKHFSTIHLTAVPGISVAKGGERELASAEVQESDTVRYVGPFDLRGGQAVFRFDGGHIYIPFTQTYQPHFFCYHVNDHLRNVRVTKIGVGETGYVLQRMNYYPFGGMYEAEDVTNNAMPWKFGGKELDQMHGLNMYDFHARPYDARLGQFTMMDPKAEDYYEVSPYTYCHDDPVNRVDPDGKDDYFSTSGQYIKTVGTGADIYIGKTNFRDLNLMSDRNMKVAARVIGHYARQVGIKYNMNGGTGKVGLGNLHPSSAILAATLPNGDIYINRVNGKLNSEMYNLYNLKSTLRHEGEHKSDFESKKTIKNKSVRHAEIILNEIAHPDFAKGTESFQEGIIGNLTYYVNKSNRNISAFEGLVKKSNQVLYKVGYKLEIYRNHVYYERK